MTNTDRPLKLAVLIDADNASAAIAGDLFHEIAKIGEAMIRRIYGDFANGSKGWSSAISRHAIIPKQQFPNVTHKNATDIALVIDAMDLLHSGRFDGFCLVSSDSDFTRLATRIREQGLAVYGFGKKNTPDSFRWACLAFSEIEDLTAKASVAVQAPKTNEISKPAAKPAPWQTPEQKARLLLPTVRKAFDKTVGSDGWASLNQLGKATREIAPNFSWKGFASLGRLMQKTGAFVVEGTGPARRARLIAPAAKIAAAERLG